MGTNKKEAASFQGSLLHITTKREAGNEIENERRKNKECLLYSRKRISQKKWKWEVQKTGIRDIRRT